MTDKLGPGILPAFLNARGAPPPLAFARRLRAALRPQALPIQPLKINHIQPGTTLGKAITLAIAITLLMPPVAHAEYRRVELKIFGMDCAICAHGVRVAVQKVDGVDAVELSLERAEADIRLRAGNTVSLDRFRQIAKGNGFEPKEAKVTALGAPREAGGKLTFEVSGVAGVLIVAPDKTSPAVLTTLKSAVDAKAPVVFEVTGSVEKRADGTETIAITTATRR
jgi:copper chaperone CopZ